jgi:hypothetical protein
VEAAASDPEAPIGSGKTSVNLSPVAVASKQKAEALIKRVEQDVEVQSLSSTVPIASSVMSVIDPECPTTVKRNEPLTSSMQPGQPLEFTKVAFTLNNDSESADARGAIRRHEASEMRNRVHRWRAENDARDEYGRVSSFTMFIFLSRGFQNHFWLFDHDKPLSPN